MRSSSVEARLDLSLVLRGEAAPVAIQGILPTSVGWDRNRPGEPDTATISLRSEHLPVRLDLIEACHVGLWLFEHREPSLCQLGDPGFFGGVVESAKRDRAGARVELQCSDWTWFPAHHDLTERDIASINVAALVTLEAFVAALLRLMPGGSAWPVVSVGGAGAVDPRAITVRTRRAPAQNPGAKAVGASVASSYLPAILGAKTSVWGAISQVCALLGVIPEVGVTDAGGAAVYLLSAEQYQTSSDFRPFRRGRQTCREVTEGDGCDPIEQERQILSGDGKRGSEVPDFVEVSSIDPATGVRTVARWPQDLEGVEVQIGGKAGALQGVFQTAHGVVSQAQCRELARVTWLDARRRRSTGTLRMSRTWTDGGSPEDPDVLGLAPGAAIKVYRPGEWGEPSRASLLGLEKLEAAVARAEAADPEIPLWQVDEVQHSWSPVDGYSCTVALRRFLAAQDDVYLEPMEVAR